MDVFSTCVCVIMDSSWLDEPLSGEESVRWCIDAIWPTWVVSVLMSALTASTRDRKSWFERTLGPDWTYWTFWPGMGGAPAGAPT